ncbi:peptide ABC transporter ATPase [Natronorubrum tibetense GA33]|uniref:Peptide ABC transporter ATPase n=1 Tax=Natronorubrum tibetense GA33 TaxID=1114856 RepID=L9VPD6_9EURY|nr:peptide ABC transporter ATPase [Natronorubrum tibetense GA33]
MFDEPISALDVSVQAQIINLMKDLQAEYDLTYLVIAHNLDVIRQIADRIAIMYLGKIVESGPTDVIFDNPSHPYTQKLLDSLPRTSIDERHREVAPIAGDVPSPRNPPESSRFHTRCPYARKTCTEASPMYELGDTHRKACYRTGNDHEYWDADELGDGSPQLQR